MQKLGEFLFRWRGVVFPLTIATIALMFPPRLAHSSFDQLLIALGLAVIIAGQSIRILAIGWDYIERGGSGGKVAASRLVTGGMYAYCRNPMYVGNLLMVAGFLIAYGRLVAGIVGIACCALFYSAIVACEENFLQEKFGESFTQYRIRVPRWGFRLSLLLHDLKSRGLDVKAILVREYSTLSVTAIFALTMTLWRVKGEEWQAMELAALSAGSGVVLGFYLTMRYLKTRRIVYSPR
jgi:protein-S-isoprenylcysteine O-methyltransferase Ste14